MNTTTNDKKMQPETTNTTKLSRAEIRRQEKVACFSLHEVGKKSRGH